MEGEGGAEGLRGVAVFGEFEIFPEELAVAWINTVADDGIGKTDGIAPKGTGFGSQLIQLLTQQLNGKMLEINESGTSVEFQFKTKIAA